MAGTVHFDKLKPYILDQLTVDELGECIRLSGGDQDALITKAHEFILAKGGKIPDSERGRRERRVVTQEEVTQMIMMKPAGASNVLLTTIILFCTVGALIKLDYTAPDVGWKILIIAVIAFAALMYSGKRDVPKIDEEGNIVAWKGGEKNVGTPGSGKP